MLVVVLVDWVLMVGCFQFPQTFVGGRLKLAEGYEVWTFGLNGNGLIGCF